MPVRSISLLAVTLLLLGSLGCSSSEEPDVAVATGGGETVSTPDTAPAPKPALDDVHPQVVIDTSYGPVTVELDGERAPLTVKNFLEYVGSGHYDGTIFHQVEEDFIVLGGGFTPELSEKPSMMSIRNEANNGLKNVRGTISMARHGDDVDSATSQFFINLSDNAALDYKSDKEYGYCVFGKVISGLEVVEKISKAQAKDTPQFQRIPVEPIAISTARRIR